jgi:membrane protein DedA with SNARE-associated domain/membrane-associated phospholipid phosphatase
VSATLYAFIDFVAAHRHWAYALVFLVAFSESLPFLGAVIPGSTAIIGISALVPSGAVDLVPLLLAAIAGAITGDGFAFWLGYRYREQVLRLWPFRRHPEIIATGTEFFDRHGAKSVLLARFTPPVRPFVPLVAGIVHMPILRFYLANALSAVAWAPAHVFPGILLGASLALAGAVAGRLAVLLVLLVGALWAMVLLVRLGLRWGLPRLDAGLSRLWRWVISHDTGFSRLLRAYLDPAQPEFKALLVLAVALVAAAAAFAGILESVADESAMAAMDAAVFHFFQGLRTAWGDRVLVTMTELGDAAVTIPVTAAVLAWLLWRRAWHAAAYWLGAVALAAAFTAAFKTLMQVARPEDLYSGTSLYSFPSGHTIVSATMYGFLALMAAREMTPRWRLTVAGSMALFVSAIALSRLYLGAHWLSDVIGGGAFAIAWVALLGIAYLRHNPPRLGAGGLLAAAGTALALAGGTHVFFAHGADVQRYAMHRESRVIAAADWRAGAWQSLPARRIDLEGEAEEPLTLQWAGDPRVLARTLQAAGWAEEPPWSWHGVLLWLAPGADPLNLPVLPRLHDGRTPGLLMVRMDSAAPSGPARVILRLWSAGAELSDGGGPSRPLWLGAVVEQSLRRPMGLITVAAKRADTNHPRDLLSDALPRATQVRRALPAGDSQWDGKLLLAEDEAPANN